MADPRLGRGALARPGLVACALAFAGLPLYIHAPRFYAEEMGVALPVLGAVLLGARAVDSIQDPVIGWLADRLRAFREVWAIGAAILLGIGIATLFAPPGWGDPLPRLVVGLIAAFTGFSALQIVLYDHGLALAHRAGGGHTRVALWREVGGLAGICLASLVPPLLAMALGAPAAYAGYAAVFSVIAVLAIAAMAGRWQASGAPAAGGAGFRRALATPGVAPLLGLGFLNALPTAVTSTLFLFFVADVLRAEPHAGPTLLLFFAAAAAAAPFWARLAERVGQRRALAAGMTLSVLAFAWAYTLGSGDIAAFYVIAAASGAALGADMTLMPAMLAARIDGDGARVFALWTFLQKSALALGAGVTLPALALAGFAPSEPTAPAGLAALSAAYALVPCLLKLAAIAALSLISVEGRTARENS
jgi:GPH family glycoside/pentoside/hexuronide:cation symporter